MTKKHGGGGGTYYVPGVIAYTPGLIAEWPLTDQLGPELTDVSGGGFQAILQGVENTDWRLRYPSPVEGASALECLTENGYALVGYNALLNPPALTAECWVNIAAGATTAAGILSNNDTGVGWYLGWHPTNGLVFTIAGSSQIAGVVSRDTWHHLTGTFDGTYQSVYLDGTMIAQAIWGATPITDYQGFGNFLIGAESEGLNAIKGRVFWAAYFGRALSAGEVLNHYMTQYGTVQLCAESRIGLMLRQTMTSTADFGLNVAHNATGTFGLETLHSEGAYRGAMDTAARDSLAPAPVQGDVIQNTDTELAEIYDGASWHGFHTIYRTSGYREQSVYIEDLTSDIPWEGLPY